MKRSFIAFVVLLAFVPSIASLRSSSAAPTQVPIQPGRHRIDVVSTIDGSSQPSYLILPRTYADGARDVPVVVALHSWIADMDQRYDDLEKAVNDRGWIYLFPNFRGRNDHPEACASDIASRDVIDALDWVIERYPVDRSRVYVTGFSAGGLMTLALVTRFPNRWTAASAWVPLADMRAFYDFHARDNFGEMMRACFGGDPGKETAVAAEMQRRSPLHGLSIAKDLALDIAAGRFDGHDGAPLPIWHSLAAFNEIARAAGQPQITAQEIAELSRHEPRLEKPQVSDRVTDRSLGREIFLRRHAGKSRVTIFEGGHEALASAIVAWFEAHPKR